MKVPDFAALIYAALAGGESGMFYVRVKRWLQDVASGFAQFN
jgi:hypothetical protein